MLCVTVKYLLTQTTQTNRQTDTGSRQASSVSEVMHYNKDQLDHW